MNNIITLLISAILLVSGVFAGPGDIKYTVEEGEGGGVCIISYKGYILVQMNRNEDRYGEVVRVGFSGNKLIFIDEYKDVKSMYILPGSRYGLAFYEKQGWLTIEVINELSGSGHEEGNGPIMLFRFGEGEWPVPFLEDKWMYDVIEEECSKFPYYMSDEEFIELLAKSKGIESLKAILDKWNHGGLRIYSEASRVRVQLAIEEMERESTREEKGQKGQLLSP